jgi:hypothetical protein
MADRVFGPRTEVLSSLRRAGVAIERVITRMSAMRRRSDIPERATHWVVACAKSRAGTVWSL